MTADTPPTFLWHAADDENVPVENSLLFAGALSSRQVPFDLHVFESGGHGLGLAEDHPEVKAWPRNLRGMAKKTKFFMTLNEIE